MLLVTKWTLTTLWHLAFLDEAKAQILARPGLVAHIQALVHSGQEDAGTLDIARGCLWTLGLQPPVSPKRLSSGASGLQSPGGSQAKALALKLELEQRRYATWLDLDKMLGNTLAAMAEAVENAAVVVVCVSKKYKESQAVMMELGYRPNGWLGALLGTKLYYDMP
ncbi:predicted protein [Haematococcus lacustris]|uniref:TIR domain-containing protein n=1 Tax=Haematococcus lacustris TaxID=44745 RepID=A0A699Z8R3_HAELA|nr:predicted protein [Haematococcus lacustris]